MADTLQCLIVSSAILAAAVFGMNSCVVGESHERDFQIKAKEIELEKMKTNDGVLLNNIKEITKDYE